MDSQAKTCSENILQNFESDTCIDGIETILCLQDFRLAYYSYTCSQIEKSLYFRLHRLKSTSVREFLIFQILLDLMGNNSFAFLVRVVPYYLVATETRKVH